MAQLGRSIDLLRFPRSGLNQQRKKFTFSVVFGHGLSRWSLHIVLSLELLEAFPASFSHFFLSTYISPEDREMLVFIFFMINTSIFICLRLVFSQSLLFRQLVHD